MTRILPVFILVIFLLLPFSRLQAQELVSVRSGSHADYARIVFDWQGTPVYEVIREDEATLTVRFARAALADLSGVSAGQDPRIGGVATVSQDPLAVRISVKPGSDYRHFTIGSRLVVDILEKGPDTASAGKRAPPPTAEQPEQAPPRTVKAEPPPLPAQKQAPPAQKTQAPTPPVAAVKPEPVEKSILEAAAEDAEPHIITLSSTETLGLAAFIRNGYLWIVLDKADVQVKPELAGPSPDKFSAFSRMELKGGVAFTAKLPENANLNIYGEGGGLVWRLVVTPQDRNTPFATMERSFEKGETVRGGTALWPLKEARRVLDVPDPVTGDIVRVVTVGGAAERAGPRREFVDFTLLRSAVGLAIVPRADDLEVSVSGEGAKVSRPGGLALSRIRDVNRSLIREEVTKSSLEALQEEDAPLRRVFDFDRWMMGGIQALNANERIIVSNTALKDQNGRVQDLLTLAKMNLANDRGPEALGYLHYAEQELPAITDAVQYKAVRGAAYALAGKYELAMRDFVAPSVEEFSELAYWRAFALAWLEDWQSAIKEMPKDYTLLLTYPRPLLEKTGLKLAEVALRAGDVATAEGIFAVLERDKGKLSRWTRAGIDYLKGEAHRQRGETEKARALWAPLVKGKDNLYRAKAGLALTELEVANGEITPDKAIDRLEGLRYAWRGDELEARINFSLGKLYLDQRRFVKGFGILREAASMSPESDIGEEITAYMADKFHKIILEDENLSPLEAVTIYEEFTELTPAGSEGNRLVQALAEKLVEAELLGRAARILRHQVDYRIEGEEKARVAVRLAAVYLLNGEPEKAMEVLETGRQFYEAQKDDETAKAELRRIRLLRARTLSQMNRTEEALNLLGALEPAPDVNRLRADIAWHAGLWEDAAEAIQDLIMDESLDLQRPLTEDQAGLLLNRAVALNLSGNRVALNNMRKRYGDAMNKTGKSKLFDVVTRPRQSTLLADRETLKTIVAEVDIFRDFLESYRNAEISN